MGLRLCNLIPNCLACWYVQDWGAAIIREAGAGSSEPSRGRVYEERRLKASTHQLPDSACEQLLNR